MSRGGRSLPGIAAISLVVILVIGATGCSGGADATPPTNTLKWTAGSEEGAYGYLVYRAMSRGGPYRRINDTVIRCLTDDASEHSYRFDDTDVEVGKTYYYYLDLVSEGGIKQRFSGILSRTTEAPG